MVRENASSYIMWLGMELGLVTVKGCVIVIAQKTHNWWNSKNLDEKQDFKDRINKKRKVILCTGAVALGLLAGFLWYHTKLDPVTGRRRLLIFSGSKMEKIMHFFNHSVLEHYNENNLLLQPIDPEYRRVNDILQKLLKVNDHLDMIKNQQWHLFMVKDPVKNAFVCQNFVYVHTGLSNFVNDDQMSIIIGHEISHCMNQHINQQLSFNFMACVLEIIPIALIWTVLPFRRAFTVHMNFNIANNLFVKLPYNRALEVEADRDGFMLAAKVCADLTEGYKFFASLAELNEGISNWLWWCSGHPSDKSRAQHLYSLIPEVQELQKSGR